MRIVRWFLLLYLGAFVPALVGGCETVPFTGRSQLQLVSSAEETQMGTEAYKDILSKAKISNDPATNALVKRIDMAKAGYDPQAARDFWVRMADASKGPSRPPQFLSTHPSDDTWVHQIEGWLPEGNQY